MPTSKKVIAVHFDSDGYARVFTNPNAELLALPNTLVNPDLTAVKKIPMEFWKLEDGKIVAMSVDEMLHRHRDLEHEHDGTWTQIVRVPVEIPVEIEKIVMRVPWWAFAAMGTEAVLWVASLYLKTKGVF